MTEQLIQNTMFRGRGTNSVSLAHTVCLLCVGGLHVSAGILI